MIWVDASNDIGYGHASRCSAIFNTLCTKFEIEIASRYKETFNFFKKKCHFHQLPNSLELAQKQFLNLLNKSSPNIVITDFKYNFPPIFFQNIKKTSNTLVCIENISSGMIYADMVLFPALHFENEIMPEDFSSKAIKQKVFHGADWVILRDDVLSQEKNQNPDKNIVVTTGGSDPHQIFFKLWPIFEKLNIKCTFLAGESFQKYNTLPKDNINQKILPFSIPALNNSSIVISTFGVTVLESLFLNKVVFGISHNKQDAKSSKKMEATYSNYFDLGFFADLTEENFKRVLLILQKPQINNPKALIDGMGRERLLDWLLKGVS